MPLLRAFRGPLVSSAQKKAARREERSFANFSEALMPDAKAPNPMTSGIPGGPQLPVAPTAATRGSGQHGQDAASGDHAETVAVKVLRILLAEGSEMVRQGLASLLNAAEDMRVVCEAGDVPTALAQAARFTPEVAVLDARLPGGGGLEVARQLRRAHPRISLVALTGTLDHANVGAMYRLGALPKDAPFEELAAAIRLAGDNRIYLSPAIAEFVVKQYVCENGSAPTAKSNGLTERERQVLRLIAAGRHTRDIAAALAVSPKTVEYHRQQLMKRLGLHGVAELTKYALREGIATMD